MNMEFAVETSPHIKRRGNSLWSMLADVIIALLPATVMAFVAFPLDSLKTFAIAIPTMLIAEWLFVFFTNVPRGDDGKILPFGGWVKHAWGKGTVNNILAPIVSGMIFSLTLPSTASWYHVLIGALFGIVVGKLLFGGTGSNIFNPALVGMIFAKLCFGSQWDLATPSWMLSDVVAGGTPLGVINGGNFANIGQYSLLDMFMGWIPGTLGETSKLAILVGLAYLLVRQAADWRVVVSYLGSFLFLTAVAGIYITIQYDGAFTWTQFMGYEVLSGGLLFGATFMITDPVTSPVTSPSRFLYGAFGGALVVLIRLLGGLPEGVGFSILLANLIVPALDYHKWISKKWRLWHFIALATVILVPLFIIMLALAYGGVLELPANSL